MTVQRVKGLRLDELSTLEDIDEGGWLSPDGVFYPYPFAQHYGSAINIIEDNYPELKFKDGAKKLIRKDWVPLNKKNVLVRKGWILLTHSPELGIILHNYLIAVCNYRHKITAQQHRVVEKMQELSEKECGSVLISGYQEMEFRG